MSVRRDSTELPAGVEMIRVTSWEPEGIVMLYREGGWWKEEWDAAEIPALIKGSFAFIVVVETETREAIGMGRAISDGVSDAYIQDLVVKNSWRGQGIGQALLAALRETCTSAGIIWVGLIAEPGTGDFYRNSGFSEMKDHIPFLYTGGGAGC